MVRVFADASSIILLEKAGLFSLMLNAYHMIIPPSVLKEITIARTPDTAGFSLHVALRRLHVMPLPENDPDQSQVTLNKLDPGERDTLTLYLYKKQGFILTDDGRAARWCYSHDLPFTNALLVPKIFNYAGLINKEACQESFAFLCKTGWYSDKVKAFASSATQKQLASFLPGKI